MPTDALFWACFCCISTLLLGACSSEVRRGIDEPAANEMVVALHRAGIAADKLRDEGTSGAAAYRVDVAKSDLPRALSLLERAGLPRRTPQGVADVFGEPSIVPTKGEEDARWALAIGGELSRTLGAMDGVVHARVHLAVAPSRLSLVDTPSRAASASVLVTHRGRTPPISSDRIQALVAGAVPGLSADAVAVVFAKAPVSAEQHAAPLERVGPFSVTAGSAPWVRVAFSVAIGVQAALAAALLFVLKRRSLGRTSESA
jgi:type III secretion protein J